LPDVPFVETRAFLAGRTGSVRHRAATLPQFAHIHGSTAIDAGPGTFCPWSADAHALYIITAMRAIRICPLGLSPAIHDRCRKRPISGPIT
jgi:hypothetical protein